MEILLYSSAVIAALSLLLIAIFVVITLKSAKQTMGEVSETLKRVESKIGGITEKSEELMEKTNRIAADAEDKLQALNSLSDSTKNLSNSSNQMKKSFQAISDEVASLPEKYTKQIETATLLSEVAARIFYRFKREKNRSDQMEADVLLRQLPTPKQQNDYRY